jgi:hypothetical protein
MSICEKQLEEIADFSPSSSYCVNVRAAHSAGINGDVNVMIFEGLKFELDTPTLLLALPLDCERRGFTNLFLGKSAPVLRVGDGKRCGSLWIRHCDDILEIVDVRWEEVESKCSFVGGNLIRGNSFSG